MISSLLIANRGEIACRIVKTARRMNIRTIAVYSEADRHAPHVRRADEAICIGPAPATLSYLNQDRILQAVAASGAEAVHPGYGFLSENADFAQKCADAGLIFVGPPASAIRAMGLKDEAKALMERAGVPVVPGYHGPRQDPAFLKEKAYETGYPVLLKAVSGGGGKGMRRIDKAKDFEAALEAVQREAQGAFGDPRVLLEKFVSNPRHIEIQVFADNHRHAVHLFERDCSAQRRHQKVIEEAPAPGMTEAVRMAMGKAAVDAAQAVGYSGAGTVEFIADGSDGLKPDAFWFMEMNTRLQVEHPVTEMITGIDLVEWQIRVAGGEALPKQQAEIKIRGHAVEARVYAEDPEAGFLPSTGRLDVFRPAGLDGVRVDSGVSEGDAISPFYDPMIAKVIAHGDSRAAALARLQDGLARSRIAGPKTNIGFLSALLAHPQVQAGGFDTGLIDREFAHYSGMRIPQERIRAGLHALFAEPEAGHDPCAWRDPWSASAGFQFGGPRSVGRTVDIDGAPVDVQLTWTADGLAIDGETRTAGRDDDVIVVDETAYVFCRGHVVKLRLVDPLSKRAAAQAGEGAVKAPMTGKLVALAVAVGDQVEEGSFLFAVEAMKMEHAVSSAIPGTVRMVHAEIGAQVEAGSVIVEVAADEAEAASVSTGGIIPTVITNDPFDG